MEKFHFSRFNFSLTCTTPLALPSYNGSTIRGGFGHAFRRIVCAFKGKDCADCLLKDQCVYAYVFETPVPADAEMMRKYTAAPHPFIIEPALNGKNVYQEGESVSFGLTLIGRSSDYLAYFIYAFEELGRIGIGKGRGRYELTEVAEANYGEHPEARNIIYRGDNKLLVQSNGPIRWSDIVKNDQKSPPAIRISFYTPTRIKYNNRLTKDLEFHVLFRNLLRRISLLSYFH